MPWHRLSMGVACSNWSSPVCDYESEPSGRRGSVTCGLGADISLPHFLATGIWNLVSKAITGSKSQGTSFGTMLWRHVRSYCAPFSVFMQIMWSRLSCLRKRKFPKMNMLNPFAKLKNGHFRHFSKSYFLTLERCYTTIRAIFHMF